MNLKSLKVSTALVALFVSAPTFASLTFDDLFLGDTSKKTSKNVTKNKSSNSHNSSSDSGEGDSEDESDSREDEQKLPQKRALSKALSSKQKETKAPVSSSSEQPMTVYETEVQALVASRQKQ